MLFSARMPIPWVPERTRRSLTWQESGVGVILESGGGWKIGNGMNITVTKEKKRKERQGYGKV